MRLNGQRYMIPMYLRTKYLSMEMMAFIFIMSIRVTIPI